MADININGIKMVVTLVAYSSAKPISLLTWDFVGRLGAVKTESLHLLLCFSVEGLSKS